jgi:hypothetical protein
MTISVHDYLALWWHGEIRVPERELLKWARRERLLPLLGWRSQTQGWALPQTLDEAIHRRRREVTAGQLLMHEQLEAIGAIATECNIPVILVKGAAAAEAYPAAWMRPYGDIDLLVTEDDGSRLFRALKQHGYNQIESALGNRHVHLPPLQLTPEAPWVEIHTSLALRQGEALFTFKTWQAALRPSRRYPGLHVPHPADHLLYLIFHGIVQHEMERSVQVLTDLKFWTEDWKAEAWAILHEKATEAGLLRAVGLALALAAWFWDAPWPDEVSALFPTPPEPLLARSQAAISTPDAHGPLPHLWQHVISRDLAGTLAYLRLVLLGDPAQQQWMSAQERLRYFLRRPGTLLRNYGATLRRLLEGDPELRAAWRTQRELQTWLREG